MDPTGIELANAVAKCAVPPIVKLAGERAVVEGADALADAFPVLRRLKALQIHQLKRAVEVLQLELRKVQLLVEGERALGFANMCYRYFAAGAKEHRELKLRMLASTCAHCGDQRNVDRYDEQIGFFDTVERLQPAHVQVLKHLRDSYPESEGGKRNPARYKELLAVDFPLPKPQEFWMRQALADLYRENTIILWGGIGAVMRDDGRFAMASATDNMIRDGEIYLNTYGRELLRYVESALTDND